MNTVEKVAECDSWTPVLKVVINRDTILPLSHVQRMELLVEREEKRVWKLGSKREAVWHRDLCRLKEIQVSENVTIRYYPSELWTLSILIKLWLTVIMWHLTLPFKITSTAVIPPMSTTIYASNLMAAGDMRVV